MSDEYSKKIVNFPDLHGAWTCGNCEYFILSETVEKNQDPNAGECHEGPTIPVTVEAMVFQGKMQESALSPNAVLVQKIVPQIVWMFARTSKILTGCGRFQVREKEKN